MASFESAVTVDDGRSAGDSAIKLLVCVSDAPAEQAINFVPPKSFTARVRFKF